MCAKEFVVVGLRLEGGDDQRQRVRARSTGKRTRLISWNKREDKPAFEKRMFVMLLYYTTHVQGLWGVQELGTGKRDGKE